MPIEEAHALTNGSFDLDWAQKNGEFVVDHLADTSHLNVKNCPKLKQSLKAKNEFVFPLSNACDASVRSKTGKKAKSSHVEPSKGAAVDCKEDEPCPRGRPSHRGKSVVEINVSTGSVIAIFESVVAAARASGVDASTISKICLGRKQQRGRKRTTSVEGVTWRYHQPGGG